MSRQWNHTENAHFFTHEFALFLDLFRRIKKHRRIFDGVYNLKNMTSEWGPLSFDSLRNVVKIKREISWIGPTAYLAKCLKGSDYPESAYEMWIPNVRAEHFFGNVRIKQQKKDDFICTTVWRFHWITAKTGCATLLFFLLFFSILFADSTTVKRLLMMSVLIFLLRRISVAKCALWLYKARAFCVKAFDEHFYCLQRAKAF